MSHCLVTGGGGFIGSHIVDKLLSEGHQVRVLDNFSTGNLINLTEARENIDLIEGDIREFAVCQRATQGVDWVFHEAALPSDPRSINQPIESHDCNINGTFNMLMASHENKVKRFVYAASSSAYGDTEELPKIESMPPNPLSPYALQKFTGEKYCHLFSQQFNLETICLRYFNIFGPRQNPNSEYAAVIPKFIQLMNSGKTPTIFGDGSHSRDFTFIDNAVHANLLAAKAPTASCGETYNVGCGDRFTLIDLVNSLNELMDKSVEPNFADRRAGDVPHSMAGIDKIKSGLGYEPQVDFKNGLQKTVNWMVNEK